MWGRWMSSSSRGCHGRDGCWEAIRITVVPWESLIFWRVLGTMGAGGKAYTRPKPSHDTTWRGHLPPKLCRLGRVKCKLESPGSPPWQTCPLGGSLRQRTARVRFPEEATILSDLDCWVETGHRRSHSWLRGGELEWVESQTGPEDEWVPEFCWTEIWNGSLPACVYGLLLYCYRSICGPSDWSRAVPTGEQIIGWLLVPASWWADWSPEETTVRRGDDLTNWLPSLLGMHRWRRTAWVPVDAEELPWEHPVCWTNAGKKGILHSVVLECPRIACVGPNVPLSRTEETWAAGVHDG